ncbi:MAG: hypothetical protein EOS51_18095 [Mesorhizobium sp.]|uniref:hypothetical protein n=1 Tax=unclassified Mesorhizobium TaxID=325217 RepID=UPI000FEA2AE1|nr:MULTISPECIES: hypothetical protein [unclassified Mesorhizobium]RWC17041.1 MAG: hypothetical protein EOS51_18095 [Mesorhizobium sp.]TGU01257.1 hypothetical protein EN807_16385 [Mesorhizobium sp. M5C.F.Ca.ET.164.01.1.1]
MTAPLLPSDHASAVAWLRENWTTAERPLIPAIRRRFDVGPIEAVQILREASPHRKERSP